MTNKKHNNKNKKSESFLHKLARVCFNPVKEEVKEIKSLKPTEEDREQGKRLAILTVAALSAMGIPLSALGTEVIAVALTYGLRDLKDGLESHDKLIVARVINEIRKPTEI